MKFCDFGISKSIDNQTQTKLREAQTSDLCSLERAKNPNGKIDYKKDDIWSLGIVFLQMVLGKKI